MFVVFSITATRTFQNMHSTRHTNRRESAQQARNTATSYDWHFTAICSGSPLRGVSSQLSRGLYFSICKATRVVVKYLAKTPSNVKDGGTPSGLLQACWKPTTTIWKTVNTLRKPQSKHSTRLLLAQKCKYRLCYNHRTGSCNFTQSRTEVLRVARSRAAGEGREGAPRSIAPVEWFIISHFRDQMLPITRSREVWEIVREVTVLAGVPMSPAIDQNRPFSVPSEFTRKCLETICKQIGGVSGSLERFLALIQFFKTMGA